MLASSSDKEGSHAQLYRICSKRPERQPQAAIDLQALSEAGPSAPQAGVYTQEVNDQEMQEALRHAFPLVAAGC